MIPIFIKAASVVSFPLDCATKTLHHGLAVVDDAGRL